MDFPVQEQKRKKKRKTIFFSHSNRHNVTCSQQTGQKSSSIYFSTFSSAITYLVINFYACYKKGTQIVSLVLFRLLFVQQTSFPFQFKFWAIAKKMKKKIL
jgi:hypothetical protein